MPEQLEWRPASEGWGTINPDAGCRREHGSTTGGKRPGCWCSGQRSGSSTPASHGRFDIGSRGLHHEKHRNSNSYGHLKRGIELKENSWW